MQNKFTIQDIFKQYSDEYIDGHNLSKEQWKVFNAIRNCGTENLGYHICTCEKLAKIVSDLSSYNGVRPFLKY